MEQTSLKFCFAQQAGSDVHKLYIYDDVTALGKFDWVTWEHKESETSANYFRQQLSEIPESGEIELHVNSNGGSVKEGTAIYNLLKQHGARKTCYVDGFAYSIASVICLACDKIIMGAGTSMLIHNMSMTVRGGAKTLRKCADDLDVLAETNRKIYMARAKNLTEDELIRMMDAETFLTPEQCLEYGFCDEIADYSAAPGAVEARQWMVQDLRQQLGDLKTLRQELLRMAVQNAHPAPEAKLNKVTNMANAFLTAFAKEE